MLIKWPQDQKDISVSSSIKDRCQGNGVGSGEQRDFPKSAVHGKQVLKDR